MLKILYITIILLSVGSIIILIKLVKDVIIELWEMDDMDDKEYELGLKTTLEIVAYLESELDDLQNCIDAFKLACNGEYNFSDLATLRALEDRELFIRRLISFIDNGTNAE